MEDRRTGPLRRLVEDVNDLHRRIAHLENTQSRYGVKAAQERYEYEQAYKSDSTTYIEVISQQATCQK
jgi:hypothetical protein